MINLKEKHLIKQFINWVAHDGDARRYILINNTDYINRFFSFKKRGNNLVKIKFILNKPSYEELDLIIDNFIKNRSNN